MTAAPRPIGDVAAELGLAADDIELHGRHRATVGLGALDGPRRRARYVLVTATTPTPAGEGKTVTALGLAMALARSGRRAVATLRQSSLGPTLGGKGGGAGGGAATVEPLAEALLGTGADLFAVETATNLLAAVVDDALHRGRPPLDPDTVTARRAVDVDDRALRRVRTGLGAGAGPERDGGFDITAASEAMAVLALAADGTDLRARLGRIVAGFGPDGRPVTADGLRAGGAMAALLARAASPTLLQSSEGTPVLIHAGPFGNVGPGVSSVIADRMAAARADWVVTEAGFGADLGAEKFLHLKCPVSGLWPDVAVVVTTVRALRHHGGGSPSAPGAAAVTAGAANLAAHVGILRRFGLPVVVAVNRFAGDTAAELEVIRHAAAAAGAARVAEHIAFDSGGAGCAELADAVTEAATPSCPRPLYGGDDPVADKVAALATRVYGAGGVTWSDGARRGLDRLEAAGFGRLPVCVAKTHLSLSHDPARRGAPSGFDLPVTGVRLAAGAGYVLVLAGDIVTMPGLPARPLLAGLDVDDRLRVTGLR